jgi:hypothetical protein
MVGIKGDTGTTLLAGTTLDVVTEGLDGLRERWSATRTWHQIKSSVEARWRGTRETRVERRWGHPRMTHSR